MGTIDTTPRTAILYFSLSPEAEAERNKQWLAHQNQGNQRIAHQLHRWTIQHLEQSGLPVYQYDEHKQKGSSFGLCLAHAYQELFDSGYDHVISVGNDSPTIAQINWSELKTELAAGKALLGPNFRKGAYLIGLSRAQFDFTQFATLPWKRPELWDSLLEYVELHTQAFALLAQGNDLNTKKDLLSYLRSGEAEGLTYMLLYALGWWHGISPFEGSGYRSKQIATHILLRGPPLAFSG